MLVPEVTGISPSEGSIKGNERVILRGSNLGQTKEDIIRVTIANVECLETLEYFSSGGPHVIYYTMIRLISLCCVVNISAFFYVYS